MTRSVFLFMFVCASAACSSSPTTPSTAQSSASPSAGAAGAALAAGSSVSIIQSPVVNFASCLQGTADPACFSGARSVVRTAVASATAPGAPVNLVATPNGNTVTLTWGAPSSGDPVVTYIIEAGSAPGLANLANITTNNTATTFSATGVGNGTYYVRVRAQNAAGMMSAPSDDSRLVVGGAPCTSAPNAPSGLTNSPSGSTVTFTWTAPSAGCAVTSYLLQAGSASGQSNLASSNIGSATSYVAIGVGNGVYYVRVLATNASGQSAPSNEVVVTVGASPGQNVSGRWIGLAPDGMVSPAPNCQAEADLMLDLTQTGSTVTGTVTDRTRLTRCENNSGRTRLLVGTVGAGVVSFDTVDGHCSGTFTATRMTGSCVEITGTYRATWAVNRQ